jgi:hypothetical protein
MSEDTISRQAAIDAMCEACSDWCDEGVCKKVSAIQKLPSAEPETAKRIVFKTRNGIMPWYQCDTCNEPVDAQDNYCRGCGRRLNG